MFYGLKIWCSLLLTSHSWVRDKQLHDCEVLKLNQEPEPLEFLVSLYPREVRSGITQPPASEWRSPTPVLAGESSAKSWELRPAPWTHWVTLGHPTFLWEFWVTSILDGEQGFPGSAGSFCCWAVPGYLSSLMTPSVSPINLYSCYTELTIPKNCLVLCSH